MRIVSLHGDGAAHRIWPTVEYTPDPWSFAIPAGWSVVEADGRSWSSPYPVVAVFWPERFYQVFILLKPGFTEYYCNVISPPSWLTASAPIWGKQGSFSPNVAAEVRFHDLDLDVYVDATGIRVLDEDEFSARQQVYPHKWVESAQIALQELRRLATTQQGPFAPVTAQFWRRWLAKGRS